MAGNRGEKTDLAPQLIRSAASRSGHHAPPFDRNLEKGLCAQNVFGYSSRRYEFKDSR